MDSYSGCIVFGHYESGVIYSYCVVIDASSMICDMHVIDSFKQVINEYFIIFDAAVFCESIRIEIIFLYMIMSEFSTYHNIACGI